MVALATLFVGMTLGAVILFVGMAIGRQMGRDEWSDTDGYTIISDEEESDA